MRTIVLTLAAALSSSAGPALAQALPATGGNHVLFTPRGAAVLSGNPGGVQTALLPQGGTGIVTNNGNGTSTITGPNGRVTTVPSNP